MKEFFGFGGYSRMPEGYMSPEHLIFVSSHVIVMIALAIVFGIRFRGNTEKKRMRPLAVAAILMDSIEIFKIVIICIRNEDPLSWLYMLPLFLCSIQLITIPLAAFAKGRVKEAALDFVAIFGLLGAVLGTYGAGNNYGTYPVLSIDNVASSLTHCIAGFSALYVLISRSAGLKKRNMPIAFLILTAFCVAAYAANILLPYNYMFLMRGDGTPYDILYDLLGGNPVLYPLAVFFLFILYIAVYYLVFYLIKKKKSSSNGRSSEDHPVHNEA
ncbi:MAG: YwaF family protein [Clostridia bacterium]|nr:YwaF family protein [Clostridia bacterium]